MIGSLNEIILVLPRKLANLIYDLYAVFFLFSLKDARRSSMKNGGFKKLESLITNAVLKPL